MRPNTHIIRISSVMIVALFACIVPTVHVTAGNRDAAAKDPFYHLYGHDLAGTILMEGTVRTISPIPDPRKNDYPDCLYSIMLNVNSVLSNANSGSKIAKEVIINVPVMKDKQLLKYNTFKSGDKIVCACVPYDQMPGKVKEIQISDMFQSFEHDYYYALNIRKIDKFKTAADSSFAKRQIRITPISTLPRDEKSFKSRKKRIRLEIQRIENQLKQHGGSFEKWKEEYKPIAEKYMKLSAEGGWIGDSYFAAGGKESVYHTKEYIKSILPYKKYLEQNNIDLIIVRMPSKYDFAARVLGSDDFQENPAWVEHYYECLKNDIEILDPMPEMWKRRYEFPLFYFYNSKDSHPFEGNALVSAKVLSEVLKRYDYPKVSIPITLEYTVYKTKSDHRFFWPKGNGKFPHGDNVFFKRAAQNGRSIGSLTANSGSPLLFLSNSFFYYPMREKGASLPAYTAYYLQTIPDWFYQSGSHGGLLRSLVAEIGVLHKRRAVIMVGDRWGCLSTMPKYLLDNPKSISLEKTITDFSSDIKIIDNEKYTLDKTESGEIKIQKNKSLGFAIEMVIPPMESKSNCMIKFNYLKNSYISHSVIDAENGEMIEAPNVISPQIHHIEFFVPVPSPRKIRILLRPIYANGESYLKNIELWYY